MDPFQYSHVDVPISSMYFQYPPINGNPATSSSDHSHLLPSSHSSEYYGQAPPSILQPDYSFNLPGAGQNRSLSGDSSEKEQEKDHMPPEWLMQRRRAASIYY